MYNKVYKKNKYIKYGGLPGDKDGIILKKDEVFYTPVILDNTIRYNNCKFYRGIIISSEISIIIDKLLVDCLIYGDINIPRKITSIGESSFLRYQGMYSKVILNEGLINIGPNAFYNSSIKHIRIPNTVKHIGTAAFGRCYMLIDVRFEDNINLEIIETKLFYECYNLKFINIPSSVYIIRAKAFSKCINLTIDNGKDKYELKLNRNIQEVEHNAFEHCQSLKIITIEKREEIILGDRVFYGCIGIDEEAPSFWSIFFKGYHSGIDTFLYNPPKTNNEFYRKFYEKENVEITGYWFDERPKGIVYYDDKSYKYIGTLDSQNKFHGQGSLYNIGGIYNCFIGNFIHGKWETGCAENESDHIFPRSSFANYCLNGKFNVDIDGDFRGIYIQRYSSSNTSLDIENVYNVYVPDIKYVTLNSIKTYIGSKINTNGETLPIQFIEGYEYIGDVYRYQRHGHGTVVTKDGFKLIGNWIRNNLDRTQDVEILYRNGKKYIGRVADWWTPNGRGIYTDPSQSLILNGIFMYGIKDFCGIYQLGMAEPKNVIMSNDVIIYEGETNDSCLKHGYGRYKFNLWDDKRREQGRTISGYWLNDILDETQDVAILYSDGSHYNGKVHKSSHNYLPNGKGIYTDPSQSLILNGIFKNGLNNFCGIYQLGKEEPKNVIMSDTIIIYEGETNDSCLKHGYGRYKFNLWDDDVDDKRRGQGRTISGYWLNDILDETRDAKILYSWGARYKGKVQKYPHNYLPNGKGIYTDPSQSYILNGIFKNGINNFCGIYQLGKEEPKNVIMSDNVIIYEGETNDSCLKHGNGTEIININTRNEYNILGQWVNNTLIRDKNYTITQKNGYYYHGLVIQIKNNYYPSGKGEEHIRNHIYKGIFIFITESEQLFCGSYIPKFNSLHELAETLRALGVERSEPLEKTEEKNIDDNSSEIMGDDDDSEIWPNIEDVSFGINKNIIAKRYVGENRNNYPTIVYIGETNEQCKKDGFGKYFSRGRTEYIYGEWLNDELVIDNDVKIISSNGYKYIGKVIPYKEWWILHGNGVETINGITYSGNFTRNNLLYGIVTNPNKWTYTGELSDHIKNGQGKVLFQNGNSYEGEFKNDEYHGQGILRFHNGDIYTGEFNRHLFHGHGILRFHNGDIYTGQFKNGNYHGQGILRFHNGDIYTGQFKNGNYHGHGELRFHNGDIYTGEFIDHKYYGHGELRLENGDIFDGQFKNGLLNGEATLIEKNGCIYSGSWLNGERNGMGDQVYVIDNTPLVNYFVDKISTLREEYRNCDEIINMPQYPKITQTYRGNWENNLRHGRGTLYDDYNRIISGDYWMNDEPFDIETLKLRHNRRIDAETVRRESGGIMIVPLTENIPGTQIPYINLARVIKMDKDKIPKDFFTDSHNVHKFPLLFKNLEETINILKIVNHTPQLDVEQNVNQKQMCELVIEFKKILITALEQSTDRQFNINFNERVPDFNLRSEIKSISVLKFNQDRKGLCVYLIISNMLTEIYRDSQHNFMNLNRGKITCYHILLLVINFLKLQTSEFRKYWAELYIQNIMDSYGINVSDVTLDTHISCVNGIAERSLFFLKDGLLVADINDQLTESHEITFPKAIGYSEYQEKRKDIREGILMRFHEEFQNLVGQDNLDSECNENKDESICKQNNKCIWKPSEWLKCQSLNCNLSNILSFFEIKIRELPIDNIPTKWLNDVKEYVNTSLSLEYFGGGKIKKYSKKSNIRYKQFKKKQSRNKQSRKKKLFKNKSRKHIN